METATGRAHTGLMLLSGSVLALCMAQGARAASPATPAAPEQVATSTTANAQAQAGDSGDIVVTAQRRSQSILDVPISINAFSGTQLKEMGVTDARDLAAVTPGLTVKPSLGDQNLVFTIRGIGINSFFAANNPSTSVYINQVPLNFSPLLSFQMFDIDRVEVLKGPQGTLYGRNTTSGAVNFITRKPSADWNGYFDADYGNYEDIRLEGAVGGPLAPNLNFRASGTTNQRGTGWEFNRLTNQQVGDQHYSAGRLQLGWDPTSNLDLLVDVHGGRTRGQTIQYQHVGTQSAADPNVLCAAYLAGYRDEGPCVDLAGYYNPSKNPFVGDWNDPNSLHTDTYGASATMDLSLPRMTLTAIGGYEHFNRNMKFDGDGSPYSMSGNTFIDRIRSTSAEIRLSSSKDWNFDWIIGANYSHDDISGNFLVDTTDQLGTDIAAPYAQKTDAYAAYGNITIPIAGRLKFTGGLRYTYESRNYLNITEDLAPRGTAASLLLAFGICTPQSNPNVAPVICSEQAGTFHNSDLSWTAGLNYKLSGDGLIYAKASKGFKSGGINAAINFGNTGLPFKPEELYAYEAGVKGTLFDRRLRYSTAIYYYDWRNMQVFTLAQQGPLTIRILTNAGQGQAYGAEGDLTFQPNHNLTFNLGANYNHTRITRYDTAINTPNYTGNDFANSPRLSISGSIKQQIPINDHYRFTAMIDGDYRSSQYFEIANRPFYREPGYALFNGRLAFSPSDGKWEVSAWAKNIFNKLYRVDVIEVGSAGSALNAYGQPRTYGVSLHYTF